MTQLFQGNRQTFLTLLENNPGVLIFKFTADWCSPCQQIKPDVEVFFKNISSNIINCYEVNVDECFDLFAFMKSKKMMRGIPTMLAYKKGNTHYSPDHSMSGTDLTDIKMFFETCNKLC